jgi:cell division septal protein FtsQ
MAEEAILQSGLGVADVEKKFPNKILVDFKEIKPKFLYCKEQNCFYIDKEGILYETAPFFSDSPLPVLELEKDLKIGEEFLPKNESMFLLELQKEIQILGFQIKKIKIENDIKLTMNEGWQLILLLENKDSEGIVEKLSLLFERKIKDSLKLEYIDMRFPNKAFYKLKTEDEY